MPLSACVCDDIQLCGSTDAAGKGAGKHAGEFRDQALTGHYCSRDSSELNPSKGEHLVCAHYARDQEVIKADHWSCCGARGRSDTCTAVQSAASAAASGIAFFLHWVGLFLSHSLLAILAVTVTMIGLSPKPCHRWFRGQCASSRQDRGSPERHQSI